MLQNVYVFSSCVYIHIRNQTKIFSKINTKNICTTEYLCELLHSCCVRYCSLQRWEVREQTRIWVSLSSFHFLVCGLTFFHFRLFPTHYSFVHSVVNKSRYLEVCTPASRLESWRGWLQLVRPRQRWCVCEAGPATTDWLQRYKLRGCGV